MDYIFILFILVALVIGFILGFILMKIQISKYESEIYSLVKENRKDAVKRSRSVLSGLVNEQLAPYLPNFPFNPSEIKFLGKPIDFIVFSGLDNKEVKEVVFVEVKTGGSVMSKTERSLKDAIEGKRVRWYEYRIK
ncbi:MAG: Holliday junction resolvase-like protein [Candidatus ainarchaeum sp.]|nr:Holliday junction resolvase-like protein [Candidatus ainarchaeum sp.]